MGKKWAILEQLQRGATPGGGEGLSSLESQTSEEKPDSEKIP